MSDALHSSGTVSFVFSVATAHVRGAAEDGTLLSVFRLEAVAQLAVEDGTKFCPFSLSLKSVVDDDSFERCARCAADVSRVPPYTTITLITAFISQSTYAYNLQ